MAAKGMWEVDPETKSKLQQIQKTNENNKCIDCGAPSPQWASPKLGIFFCLACSGIHRSLGVHISFVRSVTMDAFKKSEVLRMESGGNKPFKDFFNGHSSNTLIGRTFDDCTINERYDSEAGEEWKEKLTCKVEGREFDGAAFKKARAEEKLKQEERQKSRQQTPSGSGRNTPSQMGGGPLGRVKSPPGGAGQRSAPPSQKEKNEEYFARMGNANASRPEDLPPSQGGKFGGFGSGFTPESSSSGSGWQDDFQKDPLAGITKGLGWLGQSFAKQAATVNKQYIQPGMKNLQESDFAAQAQRNISTLGQSAQKGFVGVGEQFNKFVDPEQQQAGGGARKAPEKQDFWDSFGEPPKGPPKEKKDFWDDFAEAGETKAAASAHSKPSSLGTSAMKTNNGPGGQGGGKGHEDGWSDW
ncbi:zinc finger protein gcs1 [Polychaeton citri CBS 116435]|uniref:Zinc finger protein gcs1 n=1 Tax=Polychaeton citri CBS 116435 TaxID=1314669 RepID=A0A9P4Q4Q4_9PEZI|nr:zinc finger protein gcs1 [Polychaeton citri CBS 116435]